MSTQPAQPIQPARQRPSVGPQEGMPALDLQLQNKDGAKVRLSDYWQRSPIVLVFLRHFGWPFCREHVSQLRQDYQQFQDRGAEIVVVTMGNPEKTTTFWNTYRLPFPGLCDPQQRAYQTYSLPDGDIRLLAGPGILGKTFTAFFKHGVSKSIGSGLQMPGVFIIDQQGIVRYNHPYQSSADNPPNGLILQKLAAMKSVMEQPQESADIQEEDGRVQ